MARKIALFCILIAIGLTGIGLRAGTGYQAPAKKLRKAVAVMDYSGNKVHIIDADTDLVALTYSFRNFIEDFSFSYDKKVYVTVPGLPYANVDLLAVIDTSKAQFASYKKLGEFTSDIELHKSGRAVIFAPTLTNKGFKTLVYDTKKHKIIKSIFTKDALLLSGNLKRGIFASGYHGAGLNKGQLYVFNPKLLRLQPVIKHNHPRTPPFFIQRYKNLLIGTNSGYNRLSIVDIKKKRIVKTFKTEPKPYRTAISGIKLFVAHYDEPGSKVGNMVTVFNIKKMQFTGDKLRIDEPSDICISNNKLYVINGKENQVQVYNPNNLTLIKTIQFNAQWLYKLSAYDENNGPMSRRLLSN